MEFRINFISEKIIFLIEKLLTLKNKIILDLILNIFKRSKSVLNKIKEKFINQDFIFDQDPDIRIGV